MFIFRNLKKFALVVGILCVAFVVTNVALALDHQSVCCGLDPHYNWVDNSGAVSNQVGQMANQDVPFPLPQIKQRGGFLERVNLRERLLRFNDPNKIGYLYILSSLTGKPIGYYTIKGKISSTNSQLTETQQANTHDTGNNGYPIDSIGDDGTWGPEEGGSSGVFFFTTGGVMVETVMPWLYSDAPLPLSVPSLNPKKAPSTTSTFWKKSHK